MTKITKEKARENRLDVLEGRAYVAELIEKKIGSLDWQKCAYERYIAKLGPLDLIVFDSEYATIWSRGFRSRKLADASLAEGSYERIAKGAKWPDDLQKAIRILSE